ncbi:MAG TPA: nucleotidyltransferase domain-containing protein [Solirubrobacteraceae bacterium]|nr:nucleotidyltransferase domain-containing protein [Solirubrobacteraceae bacterium]
MLQVLAGTNMGLTGRQVALLAGRNSHSGVLQVLNRLTDQGLVDRVELNRAYLFALNRKHLAAPAVELLMGMREELIERIRRELDGWQIAPVHVSLFGSTARGDGDTRSDIDLFVVRPNEVDDGEPAWCAQIDDLQRRILRWTGNHAGIMQVPESQMTHLLDEEPPIVAELRADAITLHGPEINALSYAA